MNEATKQQPPPTGQGHRVLDRVLADLRIRSEQGRQKYGTELRTNNGRDPLTDAYQEALDLVQYLAQAIMEREAAAQRRGEN